MSVPICSNRFMARSHLENEKAQSLVNPCAPCAAYPRILARATSSHRLAPMGAGPVRPWTAVNYPDARLCHDHWAPPALTNARTVAHYAGESQQTGTREHGNNCSSYDFVAFP